MKSLKAVTDRRYTLLLAAVIMARSSAYLFSKMCLASMGAFTLLGIRFLLAFVLLAALFWRRLRRVPPRTVLGGVLLGTLFFAVTSAELRGLRTTDSSTASFLENTAIVLVPLLEALLHKKLPKPYVLICCGLTFAGIAFLTLGGNGVHLRVGELFCLLAALFYAMAIVATDRLSHRHDPLALGVIQVGTVGVLGAAAAFIFEKPALPSDASVWMDIAYLSLVCTVFGFTLQPLAQSRTSAAQAGMFCALNPLTAAVLGMVFLHERFAPSDAVGAVLIVSAILLYGRGHARGNAGPKQKER